MQLAKRRGYHLNYPAGTLRSVLNASMRVSPRLRWTLYMSARQSLIYVHWERRGGSPRKERRRVEEQRVECEQELLRVSLAMLETMSTA
jgi:hypothetical protein